MFRHTLPTHIREGIREAVTAIDPEPEPQEPEFAPDPEPAAPKPRGYYTYASAEERRAAMHALGIYPYGNALVEG